MVDLEWHIMLLQVCQLRADDVNDESLLSEVGRDVTDGGKKVEVCYLVYV